MARHLVAADVPRSAHEVITKASLLATGRISLPRFAVVSRAGKGTRPRS